MELGKTTQAAGGAARGRAGHGSIKARDGWLGGCGSPISPDVRRPYWDFLGAVKLRLGGVCKVDDN